MSSVAFVVLVALFVRARVFCKGKKKPSSERGKAHESAHFHIHKQRERENDTKREHDMSSEKGLVITPTEQLPFKCECYSCVLFFFFFFFFFLG